MSLNNIERRFKWFTNLFKSKPYFEYKFKFNKNITEQDIKNRIHEIDANHYHTVNKKLVGKIKLSNYSIELIGKGYQRVVTFKSKYEDLGGALREYFKPFLMEQVIGVLALDEEYETIANEIPDLVDAVNHKHEYKITYVGETTKTLDHVVPAVVKKVFLFTCPTQQSYSLLQDQFIERYNFFWGETY